MLPARSPCFDSSLRRRESLPHRRVHADEGLSAYEVVDVPQADDGVRTPGGKVPARSAMTGLIKAAG